MAETPKSFLDRERERFEPAPRAGSLRADWRQARSLFRQFRFAKPLHWNTWLGIFLAALSIYGLLDSDAWARTFYRSEWIEEGDLLSAAEAVVQWSKIGLIVAALACWRLISWLLIASSVLVWFSGLRAQRWPPTKLVLDVAAQIFLPVAEVIVAFVGALIANLLDLIGLLGGLLRIVRALLYAGWSRLVAVVLLYGRLAARAVDACWQVLVRLARRCGAVLDSVGHLIGEAIASVVALIIGPFIAAGLAVMWLWRRLQPQFFLLAGSLRAFSLLLGSRVRQFAAGCVSALVALDRLLRALVAAATHLLVAGVSVLVLPIRVVARSIASGLLLIERAIRALWHEVWSALSRVGAWFTRTAQTGLRSLRLLLTAIARPVLAVLHAIDVWLQRALGQLTSLLGAAWNGLAAILSVVGWGACRILRAIGLIVAAPFLVLDWLLIRLGAAIEYLAPRVWALIVWPLAWMGRVLAAAYARIVDALDQLQMAVARLISLVAAPVKAGWEACARGLSAATALAQRALVALLRLLLLPFLAVAAVLRLSANAVLLALRGLIMPLLAAGSATGLALAAAWRFLAGMFRAWLEGLAEAFAIASDYGRRAARPVLTAIASVIEGPRKLVVLGLAGVALSVDGFVVLLTLPWRITMGVSEAGAGWLNRTTRSLHQQNLAVPVLNLSKGDVLKPLLVVYVLVLGFVTAPPLVEALAGPEKVVVVHWANGHMMRDGLLPQMAERFNAMDMRTASGRPINIRVLNYGSAEQVQDVLGRLNGTTLVYPKAPAPVLLTPSADHWLVHLNYEAGREIVDLQKTQSLALTWIGIVTYTEMARCLGWPQREIGYADIIELRNDPDGWASLPCSKAEWGKQPLVAYTDPMTSSTGRSVLFTLYSIASQKAAEELTVADASEPSVVDYVRQFQSNIDHYMPGTLPLNTQIHRGPRFGHFFLMPEDNLIHLYQGTEKAMVNGIATTAPPLPPGSVVMIYPKEGSILHNHSSSLVQAPWVSDEQVEAARMWTAYLREESQQRGFVLAGFRPAIKMAYDEPISPRFGLDRSKPVVAINPDRIDTDASEAILDSWTDVKKPGILTFVMDTSGSMQGSKLTQAKNGLLLSLQSMSENNQVGLLTFGDDLKLRMAPAPLSRSRNALLTAVREAKADGNTALYDAVKAGIEMVDAAPGDLESIRGVVVLSDGASNRGKTTLDGLIKMASTREISIQDFDGKEGTTKAVEQGGRMVDKGQVTGTGMALNTKHKILVFFIGIGDADMDIGRMLAEATGAAFQGASSEDLASVILEFGKYF